ncbi:MAG TPA: NADH dehydrogenase (quinone) subunit D [Thermoanaerobaculia bacterium]|jgi:NADH-quinone oxidoreductase subunit C/D|nr:NADH dehydrogenase (quinone) subunit D [Thermoanaerobaculia bacterium]
MSTLTKLSAIPYTGPAPTNRHPYIPVNAEIANARGAEIAAKIANPAMTQETGQDMVTFLVERAKIVDVLRALHDHADLKFTLPLDLFGADYPNRENGERFDVIYQLYSLQNNERVRLKVSAAEGQTVPTSVGVFQGYDWYEREVWDMYGIVFEGHPNLRRILTHEQFEGHPLRKDYDPAQRWLLTEAGVSIIKPKIAPEFQQPEEDSDYERVTLNLGPSHPATHGTLRIVVTLDGEKIIGAESEIGYLHRCFEKMCETHTYQQVIPYTDRLNYCSAVINNVGYCMAVEKLLGIQSPARADHVRLMLSEFYRISDHIVCIGTNLVDMGALTNFWYLFQPREEIIALAESCSGARLLPSYLRIGGLAIDVPSDFLANSQRIVNMLPKFIDEVEALVMKNRIFRDRVDGVGVLSQADAINYGFTGPCLRATGVPFDVRKASPYLGYETYDWDVPVADGGDTYARFLVRFEEMRQSLRILQQAIDRGLPSGPVMVDNPYVALPPKEKVYNEMESLIYHFKLIMHGIQPPVGETYFQVEGGNGEVGFYLVSDGTKQPYRVRARPPCFPIFEAFSKMITGQTIPDAIAALGSLNIIAGELDH